MPPAITKVRYLGHGLPPQFNTPQSCVENLLALPVYDGTSFSNAFNISLPCESHSISPAPFRDHTVTYATYIVTNNVPPLYAGDYMKIIVECSNRLKSIGMRVDMKLRGTRFFTIVARDINSFEQGGVTFLSGSIILSDPACSQTMVSGNVEVTWPGLLPAPSASGCNPLP